MALNSSDTNVSTLVVNKCTKDQYDAMASHSGNELYVVNEDIDSSPTQNSTNPVTSGGVKTAIDTAPRFYLGTCSTAGNVAIKQVDIPNFPTQLVSGVETPIVGSVIAVKFSNSDAAAITQKKIKVNNTSAYPVWYSGAEVVERASSHIIFGSTNTYVNYVFDGTYWVWVNHGFDSTYTPISLGFGYAYCDTAAATAAKTATLSTYNLEKGGLVVVNFKYDVPTQATLNINSKGAVQIQFQDKRIAAGVIKAGDKCLFIYTGKYVLIAIDRWGKVPEDIDNTPRQDSPSPVSSGGVYAALAALEARIAALEGNNSNNN